VSLKDASAGTPSILRAAAAEIERLTARIDQLEDDAIGRADAEAMRLMYRRGYYAGHSAGSAGRKREACPEGKVRGELRQRLGSAT
jgi:hypothetical protein